MNTMANRISGLRKSLGMSIAKAADRAGLSRAYWWEIEHGKTKGIGAEALNAIAKTLGVTMDDLYANAAVPLPWSPISDRLLNDIIRDTGENPPGGMYTPNNVYCMAQELKMRRRKI